jgi:leader peptidase (prepilin peptidase) / N-methyltransferase
LSGHISATQTGCGTVATVPHRYHRAVLGLTVATLLCAGVGALVGVVLPRSAYRLAVPAGAPSRSACADCAAPFTLGLSGWVRLGADCPFCGTVLGPPGAWLACLGALVFAALGWLLGPVPALPAYLVAAGYGLLFGAVDVACRRLPNQVLASAAVATGVLLAVAAEVQQAPGPLLRAGLGGSVLGLGYLTLALLSGGQVGMGDVKLAALLGVLLGWAGWPAVLLGGVLPYLLGGSVALVLLLARRARRGTQLPFAPPMLAGALLALFLTA